MSATDFLNGSVFAVAGASNNREKYGNKVFRALLNRGHLVHPIHPSESQIEGHRAFATVLDVPKVPDSLSIVTPPAATRKVVDDAIAAGVKWVWMQPGAEDELASRRARDAGLRVIDDGSCVLVALALGKNE